MTFQTTTEQAGENLLSCATRLAENIKSSDGHAAAMKEIVPRHLNGNNVDLAAELANSIDDPFTRDWLLSLVAEKCAAIDDDEYAFQLVEAIEDFGTQAQAHEHIVLSKSAKGEFAKALEIAETLDHADYAFADIAARQAETGDEAGALLTLEKIDFPGAKVAVLQNVALLELKKGETAKAVETLEKAAQISGEIEFPEEKIRALIEIGSHFIEAKQMDAAIEVFDKAKASAELIGGVHRDSMLANIALAFLQAGSLELADRTLDLVADKTQTVFALIGFSRKFREKEEREEALETLEEAYAILKSQRMSEIRNSRERFKLWKTIAAEFAELEKPERAIEIAQEIIDESEQTLALRHISQICTLQNKDEIARLAHSSIQDDTQKMFALIGISDAKNKAGKTDESLDFLREAYSHCDTVPQLASRSAAYNELAGRFHHFGDAEKARKLLRESLETISEIRDESSRAVTLAQLADSFEKLGFELNDSEKEILRSMILKSEM